MVHTLQVIEWPKHGSKEWWIVEDIGAGMVPTDGPFRTKQAAYDVLAKTFVYTPTEE